MEEKQNLKPLDKIDSMCNVLDKLADAQGRTKCGYIWVLTDLVEQLRSDILIMEDKIKDAYTFKMTVEDDETMSQE